MVRDIKLPLLGKTLHFGRSRSSKNTDPAVNRPDAERREHQAIPGLLTVASSSKPKAPKGLGRRGKSPGEVMPRPGDFAKPALGGEFPDGDAFLLHAMLTARQQLMRGGAINVWGGVVQMNTPLQSGARQLLQGTSNEARVHLAWSMSEADRQAAEAALLSTLLDRDQPFQVRHQHFEAWAAVQAARLMEDPYDGPPPASGDEPSPSGDEPPASGDKAPVAETGHQRAVRHLKELKSSLEIETTFGDPRPANALLRALLHQKTMKPPPVSDSKDPDEVLLQALLHVPEATDEHPQGLVEVLGPYMAPKDKASFFKPPPQLPDEVIVGILQAIVTNDVHPAETARTLALLEPSGSLAQGEIDRLLRKPWADGAISQLSSVQALLLPNKQEAPEAVMSRVLGKYPHVLVPSMGGREKLHQFLRAIANAPASSLERTQTIQINLTKGMLLEGGRLHPSTVHLTGQAMANLARHGNPGLKIHLNLDLGRLTTSPDHIELVRAQLEPAPETTRGEQPPAMSALTLDGDRSEAMETMLRRQLRRPDCPLRELDLNTEVPHPLQLEVLEWACSGHSHLEALDLCSNRPIFADDVLPHLHQPGNKLKKFGFDFAGMDTATSDSLGLLLQSPSNRLERLTLRSFLGDSDGKALGRNLAAAIARAGSPLEELSVDMLKPGDDPVAVASQLGEAVLHPDCSLRKLSLRECAFPTVASLVRFLGQIRDPRCRLETMDLENCAHANHPSVRQLIADIKKEKPNLQLFTSLEGAQEVYE